jgi:hypothetical protein
MIIGPDLIVASRSWLCQESRRLDPVSTKAGERACWRRFDRGEQQPVLGGGITRKGGYAESNWRRRCHGSQLEGVDDDMTRHVRANRDICKENCVNKGPDMKRSRKLITVLHYQCLGHDLCSALGRVGTLLTKDSDFDSNGARSDFGSPCGIIGPALASLAMPAIIRRDWRVKNAFEAGRRRPFLNCTGRCTT